MSQRGKGQLGDKTVLDVLEAARAATEGIEDPAALSLLPTERWLPQSTNSVTNRHARVKHASLRIEASERMIQAWLRSNASSKPCNNFRTRGGP